MKESLPPYKTLVLVCANARKPGERISCGGEGRCGGVLRDALKEEAARRGLKGIVRVSAAGCLDLCEEGPTVMIVENEKRTLYTGVERSDLPEIARKHFPA